MQIFSLKNRVAMVVNTWKKTKKKFHYYYYYYYFQALKINAELNLF